MDITQRKVVNGHYCFGTEKTRIEYVEKLYNSETKWAGNVYLDKYYKGDPKWTKVEYIEKLYKEK